MKFKVAICAGISLAVMASAAAFAGCDNSGDKTGNGNIDPDIYSIYTAYAEAAGDDAMTYEEWYSNLLATAKGEKGDPGKDGTNGTDGTDGKSAYELWKEQNPENGMTEQEWLESLKGANGAPGRDGTKWFSGKGSPENSDTDFSDAQVGDFYFNTNEGEFFKLTEQGWDSLLKLKSASAEFSVTAGSTQTVTVDNVQAGLNYCYIDLGNATLENDQLVVKNNDIKGGDNYTYDNAGWFIKDEDKSREGHNVYFGFVKVPEGGTQFDFTAKDVDFTDVTVEFEKCQERVFELGKKYKIPISGYTDVSLWDNRDGYLKNETIEHMGDFDGYIYRVEGFEFAAKKFLRMHFGLAQNDFYTLNQYNKETQSQEDEGVFICDSQHSGNVPDSSIKDLQIWFSKPGNEFFIKPAYITITAPEAV